MKKILLLILMLSLTCSCAKIYYQRQNFAPVTGLDFSKGKWLLGNIEIDAYVKDDFTNLVLADFTKQVGSRISYSLREKNLLLATKIPVNPTKTTILDLKKGTGFDFYINIKCQDKRNDLSNFDFLAHDYYIKQMTYGMVHVEIYDLNQGTIVFSQCVNGALDEQDTASSNFIRKVLVGCYNKIMKEILKLSTGHFYESSLKK